MNIQDPIITAPIGEFCRLSGLGRTKTYELLGTGELDSITIGKRRLIIIDSYRRLIERQRAEGKFFPRPSAKATRSMSPNGKPGASQGAGNLENTGHATQNNPAPLDRRDQTRTPQAGG